MAETKNQHPDYGPWYDLAIVVDDTAAGSHRVKSREFVYLPATAGMESRGLGQGEQGRKGYDRYRMRAEFDPVVERAISDMIGALNHKPATIELPDSMEYLLESATCQGDTLDGLLRRIHEMQLNPSRGMLWVDLPREATENEPRFLLYSGLNVPNWDAQTRSNGFVPGVEDLVYASIVEDSHSRGAGQYTHQIERITRHLELRVGGEPYSPAVHGMNPVAEYSHWMESSVDGASEVIVPLFGGQPADFVPVVIFNGTTIGATPTKPVLYDLAELALSIYRGSADHERALHQQTEDTLAIVGTQLLPHGRNPDEPTEVGSEALINVELGGSVEFVGSNSNGLSEQREALEAKRRKAKEHGIALLDSTSRDRESGDALAIRLASETASLADIGRNGARVLERGLKMIARLIGADPEAVSVEASEDFAQDSLSNSELANLLVSDPAALPICEESRHDWFRRQDLTRLTFAEEMAEKDKDNERSRERMEAFGAGVFDGEQNGQQAEEDQ